MLTPRWSCRSWEPIMFRGKSWPALPSPIMWRKCKANICRREKFLPFVGNTMKWALVTQVGVSGCANKHWHTNTLTHKHTDTNTHTHTNTNTKTKTTMQGVPTGLMGFANWTCINVSGNRNCSQCKWRHLVAKFANFTPKDLTPWPGFVVPL